VHATLVSADGFYEWRREQGAKQPYHIALSCGEPFAMARLWERWGDGDETMETFTILNTLANDVLQSLHDRMPVLLSAFDYELWLDAEFQAQDVLQGLSRPWPAESTAVRTVSPWVNYAGHEGPHLLDPPGRCRTARRDGSALLNPALPVLKQDESRPRPVVPPTWPTYSDIVRHLTKWAHVMLAYDFEESVGYWVVMTARMFQRALHAELAPCGITFRQFQVLAWLALEERLSQAELAERMEIEPATLVSVLARMERNGWIRRDACPTDRRKRLVSPTPAACDIWNRAADCARRVRSKATRGFSPEQLAMAKELLGAMRANLEAEDRCEASAPAELSIGESS